MCVSVKGKEREEWRNEDDEEKKRKKMMMRRKGEPF